MRGGLTHRRQDKRHTSRPWRNLSTAYGLVRYWFVEALKLCERHPVNGYTFTSKILLCYRDILGTGCQTDPRLHLALDRALPELLRSSPRSHLRYLLGLQALEIICDIGSPISPSFCYYPKRRPEWDGQYRLDVSKAVDGVG